MKEIKRIKEKGSGIYFIYNKNKKLMYIGKAKNIYSRLRHHIAKSNPDVKKRYFSYVEYLLIDDDEIRDLKETEYINKLKPPLNKQKTYTYTSSYNLMVKKQLYMNELEKYEEMLEKRMDETMKTFYL